MTISVPSTIVIGIGTAMRGDDGFGPAVVEILRRNPRLGELAKLVCSDGEPTRLVDLWHGYDRVVLIDAARGGSEQYGFIYRRQLAASGVPDAAHGLREPVGGGHAAGPGSAIRLAEVLGRLPGNLIIYAVHGQDFTLGAPLSPLVAAAVEHLAHQISREVGRHHTARPPGTKVP